MSATLRITHDTVDHVTETVPAFPGAVMLITPPHMHIAVQALCSAGWPSTVTVTAPGVHGAVVAGMQGAGLKTPSFAAVAAATTGFDIVPHMPKVGMLTIGANAMMLPAGVPAVIVVGTTASGTGTGGIANEHVIMAPSLTSGGIEIDVTPPSGVDQPT